jgi:hypothetical protein
MYPAVLSYTSFLHQPHLQAEADAQAEVGYLPSWGKKKREKKKI